jgi:hypothetical protein
MNSLRTNSISIADAILIPLVGVGCLSRSPWRAHALIGNLAEQSVFDRSDDSRQAKLGQRAGQLIDHSNIQSGPTPMSERAVKWMTPSARERGMLSPPLPRTSPLWDSAS